MNFLTSNHNQPDLDFEEWHDVAVFTRGDAISFGSMTRLDFRSVAVPYLHGFAILKTGAHRTRYDRAIIKSELKDILSLKGVTL